MLKELTVKLIEELEVQKSYVDEKGVSEIETIITIEAEAFEVSQDELIEIRNKMVRYFESLRPDENSHMPLEAMDKMSMITAVIDRRYYSRV